MTRRSLVLAVLAGLLPAVLPAQSTRLLHQPDVSAQYVAFAYAGDIWLAPRSGEPPAPDRVHPSRPGGN